MKTPNQILEAINRRVSATWHLDITTETETWPHSFPLGNLTKSQLEAGFATVVQAVLNWREWAEQHGLHLATTSRRVHGTIQSIPTHLTVPDLDAAARLLGPDWEERIKRGRTRLKTLRAMFPDAQDLPKVIRAADGYPATDFTLLCTAASWFIANSASGLTPRQVPIEGLHAKWLNTHRQLVLALCGLQTLGLLPRHPPRIHFTYLDQEHLAQGGRRHDSATVGDRVSPAYAPEIIIISENKDTAIHFPALRGGISVEGGGFAGARAVSSFTWIMDAPHIIYWGDMDAAGFEILDQFRLHGVPVKSILMELPAFESYERFGTSTDARGQPLPPPVNKNLPHLAHHEQELYELLTSPKWVRVRRVEQERIPLAAAVNAVKNHTG